MVNIEVELGVVELRKTRVFIPKKWEEIEDYRHNGAKGKTFVIMTASIKAASISCNDF